MSSKQQDDGTIARAIRLDLVIAVCALLISALATAASWWQTRVIAQQLGAQVWPYVTLTGEIGRDRLELDSANDGLGPAVIKSFVLSIDGKPQHDFLVALHHLLGPGALQQRQTKHTEFLFSELDPGEVLRPSSTRPLFRITNNTSVVALIAQRFKHVSMQVCYCSILATCWNVTYPGSGEPDVQAKCADRHADQLRSVPAGTAAHDAF